MVFLQRGGDFFHIATGYRNFQTFLSLIKAHTLHIAKKKKSLRSYKPRRQFAFSQDATQTCISVLQTFDLFNLLYVDNYMIYRNVNLSFRTIASDMFNIHIDTISIAEYLLRINTYVCDYMCSRDGS